MFSSPDWLYLLTMFVVVQTCAMITALVGLDFIKSKYRKSDDGDDHRDWMLVIIAICLTVQALHYLIQAHGIKPDATWVACVRAASTVIPIALVLFLLNGRVNAAINAAINFIFQGQSATRNK